MFQRFDLVDLETLTKRAVASNVQTGPVFKPRSPVPHAQTPRAKAFVFFSFLEDEWFRENPRVFLYASLYQLLNVCVILLAICNMVVRSSPVFLFLSFTQSLGLSVVEACTIGFFVFDYLIRLVTAPRPLAFALRLLNILDVVVIIPYFVTLGIELGVGSSVPAVQVVNVVKLFRLIRVMRYLQFGRATGILFTVFLGLRKALDAVFVLVVLFLLAMVFCSTLVFYAEQTVMSFNATALQWHYTADGAVSSFQSIYDSFWWALITLTFLGEGTVYPRSPLGQAVVALTVLFGIVCFIVPVALLVRSVVLQVNRFKEVRRARLYSEMQPHQLMLEVVRLSREMKEGLSELKKTQKTVGILLYKLGQVATANGGAAAPEAGVSHWGEGLSALLRESVRFSADDRAEASDDEEEIV